MQVVLQKRVPKLGLPGDHIAVKDGFGRNYLLPKGLAVLATKAAVEQAEALRTKAKGDESTRLKETESALKTLDGKSITIKVKADDNGRLFGSISAKDILAHLEKGVHAFTERDLSWQSRKELGNFEATLEPEKGMTATIHVTIERE